MDKLFAQVVEARCLCRRHLRRPAAVHVGLYQAVADLASVNGWLVRLREFEKRCDRVREAVPARVKRPEVRRNDCSRYGALDEPAPVSGADVDGRTLGSHVQLLFDVCDPVANSRRGRLGYALHQSALELELVLTILPLASYERQDDRREDGAGEGDSERMRKDPLQTRLRLAGRRRTHTRARSAATAERAGPHRATSCAIN